MYDITIKVPKIEVDQKDIEGFSLYFIAANKDMVNGNIPKTIPLWLEGSVVIAIEVKIGNP